MHLISRTAAVLLAILLLPSLPYATNLLAQVSGTCSELVQYRDGQLVGTAGALSLRFGSQDPDRFVVDYGTSENDMGFFEVDGDRVTALVIDPSDYEGEIRFERSR